MHRRRVMHDGVYTHYPPVPHRHRHVNVCSSYDIPEPLPVQNVNIYVPPYYHDYGYRRGISYNDYPYYDYVSPPPPPPALPPIVHRCVEDDDYCYCYDDPRVIYTDDYEYPRRLSRPKVKLVDVLPKTTVRTSPNRLVVSTYEPKHVPERIVIPRANVVRHRSLPVYERRKPGRLVPLYHSASPQYIVKTRR